MRNYQRGVSMAAQFHEFLQGAGAFYSFSPKVNKIGSDLVRFHLCESQSLFAWEVSLCAGVPGTGKTKLVLSKERGE